MGEEGVKAAGVGGRQIDGVVGDEVRRQVGLLYVGDKTLVYQREDSAARRLGVRGVAAGRGRTRRGSRSTVQLAWAPPSRRMR